MKRKIYTYESNELEIEYDRERCIHAAECVKGLPAVFDTNKRPWVQASNGDTEKIIKVIKCCPTGALKYKRRGSQTDEQSPLMNSIVVSADGPVYLRGNIEIQNADGEVLLNDTRVALCRCGASENKPLCDATHDKIKFTAPASFDENKLTRQKSSSPNGKLVLKLMTNGPVLVEGDYQMYSDVMQPVASDKNIALCRCGGSSNKPFCDGTHKNINFKP